MPKEEWVRLLGWMKAQGEVVAQPEFKKCSIPKHLLPRMKELWPGLPFGVEENGKVNIEGSDQCVPWKKHWKSAVEEVFGELHKNTHGLSWCLHGWKLKVHASLSYLACVAYLSISIHIYHVSHMSLSYSVSISLLR